MLSKCHKNHVCVYIDSPLFVCMAIILPHLLHNSALLLLITVAHLVLVL